jgi:hypothetical protein
MTAAQKRISRRKWCSLLGELHSMTATLHSAKHLFSILQHTLVDQQGPRLHLMQLIQQALHDWQHLATNTTSCPVPLSSLVPTAPTSIGTTDASKAGMGGFWIPTMLHHTPPAPVVWHALFPTTITHHLAKHDNLAGHITNSDFELTALITGCSIAATQPSFVCQVLHCAMDNTPMLAWANKGSTSSATARTFLLRLLAQLCRTWDFSLNTVFTPGSTNTNFPT